MIALLFGEAPNPRAPFPRKARNINQIWNQKRDFVSLSLLCFHAAHCGFISPPLPLSPYAWILICRLLKRGCRPGGLLPKLCNYKPISGVSFLPHLRRSPPPSTKETGGGASRWEFRPGVEPLCYLWEIGCANDAALFIKGQRQGCSLTTGQLPHNYLPPPFF